MRLIEEGNLHTGLWGKRYILENSTHLEIVTAVLPRPDLNPIPTRSWLGIASKDETRKERLPLSILIQEDHPLRRLIVIPETGELKDCFVAKESDLEEILAYLNLLNLNA